MAEEKLLSLKAAADYLNITESRLKELADHGIIPAYRVAGIYIRFKKSQLEQFKDKISKIQTQYTQYQKTRSNFDDNIRYTPGERLKDFWHFYDFYIISFLVIIGLLILIFRSSL